METTPASDAVTSVTTAGGGAVLVWASCAAGVLIVLVRWLTMKNRPKPSDPLGMVNWSFTDSWATTLTTLGGLLGAILSTSDALGEETTALSKGALAGLSLMFGLMALLAPVLYSAFSTPAASANEPNYRGTVGGFLVACALTLWAVLGQLLTVLTILAESAVGALSGSVPYLFAGLTVLGMGLMTMYSWRTIGTTVKFAGSSSGGAAASAAGARPWSLL